MEREEFDRIAGVPWGRVEESRRSPKQQQQKTAAAAELGIVGRPVRSTDVHKVHRSFRGRPAGSTGKPDCNNQTLCLFRSTGKEVGRPVRSTDGRVWAKICCSANCGTAGIKGCWVVSRVYHLQKKKLRALLHSKRLNSYCNHLP